MAPLHPTEITAALKTMANHKAPGSDGLTVAFYKSYLDQLLPHLVNLFEEMATDGVMPPSMREATLITLLKKDRPPNHCSSYRPLSLLNTDTKIFAKILANCLAPLLPIVVAPEQSGFVPTCSLTSNLRTLFGTMASIDQEKAFDSVEWPFLRAVLRRVGVGEIFIKLVDVLYEKPTAHVRVNGLLSEPIHITRGTRQGCPLSPLLYAIAAEPLACALREYYGHCG